MKRLLSCFASDFKKMSRDELKQAILASEGRTVLGETVVTAAPLIEGLTNAEVMASFGADLILLNEYDVYEKKVQGLKECDKTIDRLKEMVGRPIGINLEPVDEDATFIEDKLNISKGRKATKETFIEANNQGIDFICLTGNPATGVSNSAILNSINIAKKYYKGLIFAGKMHGAGINEKFLDVDIIERFIDEGADGILVPAVGTVPGVQEQELYNLVKKVKEKGALNISAIGTSQESADVDTIRQFALSNKRVGIDIHHIGDGGYGRMADPENIMALSIVVRGKRHTYFRMSQSLMR
ncbi:haloacid dehalogenase-like hydrolase [Clostridium sp. YIM B02551]|uniref:DUF7916 family protein n=1 Tax=Clostridium sp. YIM B02551 TaxID=2910679 RepID=UPI001EECAA69|nr:haloacid dehalogenase-like hydrolase [Clostridium sp. YIM B02551]